MLDNTNFRICTRLILGEFRFHKIKTALLIVSISLVCAMCTFAFCMGFMIKDGLAYSSELSYGSSSQILFYHLSQEEAHRITAHKDVKNTVLLSFIGTLSDDVMEYRTVRLAAATPDWARSIQAMPVRGRLPLEEDEIALDEMTLDALNIPHKIGATVTINWKSPEEDTQHQAAFRLCGWWSGAMSNTETCAWISQKAADSLEPDGARHIILGVNLHQPVNLEKQASRLLTELEIVNGTFTTNLSYNSTLAKKASQYAMPYFLINILVALCGILLIYNIVSISVKQNSSFYARLKNLGMTPRQIRHLALKQTTLLCLPSIPIGWIMGFGLEMFVSPSIVINSEGFNPALFLFNPASFLASAATAFMSTLAASSLPARYAARITPVHILQYNYNKDRMQKLDTKKGRTKTSIRSIAFYGFYKSRGHLLLSTAALFIALTLLSVTWSRFLSYSEDKYLKRAVCDYLLSDSTAANSNLRYNPSSHSITLNLLHTLESHAAVKELGIIKSMEIPMTATKQLRAPVIEFYEGKDQEGNIRKETMSGSPYWMAGYEKFRSTGEYTGIILGLDSLMLDLSMGEHPLSAGTFDAEGFATGDYVLASGASATGFLTTPSPGSKVIIGGREFTIMASLSADNSLITGVNSREAAFNITYYMPVKIYTELFPDGGIRNAAINIDHTMQKEFEAYLRKQLEGTGIAVKMRSDYQQSFRNARLSEVLVELLIGLVLMLIGIIAFINSLITKMLARTREFAAYESLGMTVAEQKRIVVYEGILHSLSLFIFLIPSVFAASWFLGRWWFTHTSVWCLAFRFSLLPLWLCLPIFAFFIFLVPLICLAYFTRRNVTERLMVPE